MPYNYEGNPDAIESPSPAPGPGALPIVAPPADGDPRNADSVRQMAKVTADFIAFLQSSARFDVPALVSTTSGVGRMFTNVTHTGPGTGTVKPTQSTSFRGFRYVVKIVAGGALGVGTFAISTDGGKTYGGTITIPGGGSYTGGAVDLTFAGTFTTGDLYAFRGIDTPLALWQDAGEHAREFIDHNGYLLGKVSSFREDWSHGVDDVFADSADEFFPGYARWKYTLDAGSPTLTLVDPDEAGANAGNFSSVLMTTGTDASPKSVRVAHGRTTVTAHDASNVVCSHEFQARIPSTADHAEWYVGLDASGTFSGGGTWIAFYLPVGGGNWKAQVQTAGSLDLDVDTGVAPTGSGDLYQALRIEYYGPNSPEGTALGGHLIRFLIDGSQVAIIVLPSWSLAFKPCSRIDGDGTGVDRKLQLGPVAWGINWYADPVPL